MSKTNKQTRFREVQGEVALLEQAGEAAAGPRRIRGVGAVADAVNQNRRLYPADVLREAVRMAQAKLTRSLSQGNILGEADHPPYGPRVLETVVKWEAITFNETTRAVEVEGTIIPTDAGRNVLTLMEAGVFPGLSLRGHGDSQYDIEKDIETVTRLELIGFDLVFEPSFEDAGVTALEHKQHQERGEPTMEPKNEDKGVVDAKLAAEVQEQSRRREDAEKALAEAKRREEEQAAEVKRLADEKGKLEEAARARAVADAIAVETAALPYDAVVVARIREAAEGAGLADADAVRKFVAGERARVDALAEALKREAEKAAEAKRIEEEKAEADRRAEARGFKVNGPVIETAAGVPEYATYSHELREQLRVRGLGTEYDAAKGQSRAETLARKMLEAFDKQYQRQLIAEQAALREATATSDLNLPTQISRAIIAEAVPEIVAANVFDFGLIDGSPTRVWFEAYAGESGSAPAVTDEVVAADHDAWVALANKHLRRSPAPVVTNSAGSTTYTEWTDYMIDHADGRLYAFSTGTITDAQSLKIDYTYDKVAVGEGGAIQRGKGTLAYQDVSVAAKRLAGLVNDEAVAFGQSQLGWDPVTRVVSMLIRELREMIDNAVFSKAIAASVQSGNFGGLWMAASDTESDLVKQMGIAKVAVENDYYMPRYFVMSKTNADRLSNWTGLTREGFPDALLGAAGFANMQVKGLPIFSTTAMPDTHILVVHPELVQHRVLSSRPMSLKGPFQYRDTNGNLVAAQEWYIEEYNGQWAFINNKGGYVRVA
jgi:hypothetical protein